MDFFSLNADYKFLVFKFIDPLMLVIVDVYCALDCNLNGMKQQD